MFSRRWNIIIGIRNGKRSEVKKDEEVPEKLKAFWGEEEQRNERAFAARGETSDMQFATTNCQGGSLPFFRGGMSVPPLTLSPSKQAVPAQKEIIQLRKFAPLKRTAAVRTI
jgi:hypothetical protein